MSQSNPICDVPESFLFAYLRQKAEREETPSWSEIRQEIFTSLYGNGELDPVVRIARTWSDI
jgi:hypothetical protein